MFGPRLMFLVVVTVFFLLSLAIITIRPRLVFPMVLTVATLYNPLSASLLTVGSLSVTTLLLELVGAMAAASLIVALLTRVYSPLTDIWRSASRSSRLMILLFMGMICIAAINTLLRDERAAGTPVAIAIWFFALAGGFNATGSSGPRLPGRWFLLRSVTFALGISLIGVWLLKQGGNIDVILSVLILTAFALLISSHSLFYRLAMAAIIVICLVALIRFFSNSQSWLAGVLFGGIWMCVAFYAKRTSWFARNRRLLAIVVLVSILILPMATYMLYQGRKIGVAERIIPWGVNAFGETELNLLDRPARWEALLVHIKEHQFNLKFTNFQDIYYIQSLGVSESASPHNIIITLGVFLGIPGIIIGCILLIALISSLLEAIVRGKPQARPITLAAFGIVCGFLFRNMWSNALFTWPIEITLFSLAILASWQVLIGARIEEMKTEDSDIETEEPKGDPVLERA